MWTWIYFLQMGEYATFSLWLLHLFLANGRICHIRPLTITFISCKWANMPHSPFDYYIFFGKRAYHTFTFLSWTYCTHSPFYIIFIPIMICPISGVSISNESPLNMHLNDEIKFLAILHIHPFVVKPLHCELSFEYDE